MGSATKPANSMPTATLGGGVRRPAMPPVKSASPRVAAAPNAAAGESSVFMLKVNCTGAGRVGSVKISPAVER